MVKAVLSVCLSLVLLSCTTTQVVVDNTVNVNQQLLADLSFPQPQHLTIESADDIFRLSDDMKSMVNEVLLPERDEEKRTKKLILQIFQSRNLGLVYNSSANLIAAETYHNAQANCLSLTIMAYALAQQANLNVAFQQVEIPEYWVRNGDYNLLTGHVNLLVTGSRTPAKHISYGSNNLQIDFDPFVAKKTFPTQKLDKQTVVAMFYNNIGVQYLVDKQYNEAYQYLKSAVTSAPGYSTAWGNLALLYRLNKHPVLAEQTYRYAVTLNNDNATALSNLAILLDEQGQHDEAQNIKDKIAFKRQKNPYYHAMLADEAAYAGDYQLAIQHLKHAIKLDNTDHEFYASMAKIYYRMGEYAKATHAIKKALALNKLPDIEHLYLAKLNLLKQKEVQTQ